MKMRAEAAGDSEAIEAVTVAAFYGAPHTSHNEQHIVNALRRAGKLAVSLVAESDDTIVGHIAVSPVSISDGAAGWFGLGPVSVLPQYQRRGIGTLLVCEALRIIRGRGASGCVVLGDPEYYGRFGFRVNPDLGFPGVPPEYFQSVSFDSSRVRGIVSYHAAFEAQS